MSFATLFDTPYFTGSTTSAEVPGRYDMSLNGRPYMIDLDLDGQGFTRQSIPLLRNQADTGNAPGEQSLSPEELWRRPMETWHHGAGQSFYDRPDSDPARFNASKGVDVWEQWALKLLPDTDSKRSSVATNLALMPVGSYLYLLDGTALLYTSSLTGTPTWTTVTGTPGAATSIASDGFNVWTAHGASGIYKTTRGGAASASQTTGTVSLVGYVKGRLMAAAANSLYNVTNFGVAALPAALFTHPNTDFAWVGFAEGAASIYAAGFSGDKSLIYRTAVKADGTGLDVPVVAGELPDGEIVRSIGGYLGYILLGTDKGVRFCAADANGNLTIGALIRTTLPVLCFEGQDKYVWFGWSNFDTVSTGLGRLDLQTFTFTLTPAYASDLMATGQGAVLSCATFGGVRVFAVSGKGVYAESANKVVSGSVTSGRIAFGIPDAKVAMFLDVRHRTSLFGANGASLSTDEGEFKIVGQRFEGTTSPSFVVGQVSGETFEVATVLFRSVIDLTAGPVITRVTLRAYPRPQRGEVFVVPVKLYESMLDRTEQTYTIDPDDELTRILSLQQSRQLVSLQLGEESHTVLVDDSVFRYANKTSTGKGWNGTVILRLKALAQ